MSIYFRCLSPHEWNVFRFAQLFQSAGPSLSASLTPMCPSIRTHINL